jgi:hypothetical protein
LTADDASAARRNAAALIGFPMGRRVWGIAVGSVLARALRGLMTGDGGRLWFLSRIVHLVAVATVATLRVRVRA